jgi:hypothetical protein
MSSLLIAGGMCKKNQILNSKTGRCVFKTGTIGKKLLSKSKKSPKRKIFKPKSRSRSRSPSPGERHTLKDVFKRYSPSIVKKREKRNSPFVSAALSSVGTIRKGNDLNNYIVAKRSNGVHFWKKI